MRAVLRKLLIVTVCQLIIYVLNCFQTDIYSGLVHSDPGIIGSGLDILLSCACIVIPVSVFAAVFDTSPGYWLLSFVVIRLLTEYFPKYGRYLFIEVTENVGSGIPFGSSYESVTKLIASFTITVTEIAVVFLAGLIKNKIKTKD